MPGRIILVARSDGTMREEPATGTCLTQSFDVEFTTKNTYSTMYDDQERGQSWKAGRSGYIYSIYLERENAGSATYLQMRYGETSDLSSTYLGETIVAVPAAAGWFECPFAEEERQILTEGNTYYFLFRVTSANPQWDIARDSSGSYADGTSFYDLSEDWVGTIASSDLPFKIKMCD